MSNNKSSIKQDIQKQELENLAQRAVTLLKKCLSYAESAECPSCGSYPAHEEPHDLGCPIQEVLDDARDLWPNLLPEED